MCVCEEEGGSPASFVLFSLFSVQFFVCPLLILCCYLVFFSLRIIIPGSRLVVVVVCSRLQSSSTWSVWPMQSGQVCINKIQHLFSVVCILNCCLLNREAENKKKERVIILKKRLRIVKNQKKKEGDKTKWRRKI